MAEEKKFVEDDDTEFTQIWIKKSSKEKLKKLKPVGQMLKYFTSDFVDNAVEHREALDRSIRESGGKKI
jgi:hypothetical protein